MTADDSLEELARRAAGGDDAAIARLLDLPLGTVKSRIHRARQELRPLLLIQ